MDTTERAPHEETSSQRLKNKILPSLLILMGNAMLLTSDCYATPRWCCQNATVMSHGITLQPNTSPRGGGTNWPFIYCSSSDVIPSSQVCWFTQLLSSEKKRLTFSLCQARNSICNLTSSSQLAGHLRETLKKSHLFKREEVGFWIKLFEICVRANFFSSLYQMMPTANTSHISQHFQVVSDAQHCLPFSLTKTKFRPP